MHQSISFCSWKSNKKISEDPMKIRFRRDPVIKYQVILIFVLVLLVLIKVTLLIRYIATCKLYMFSSSTWVHYKVSQMSVCSCSVINFRGWLLLKVCLIYQLLLCSVWVVAIEGLPELLTYPMAMKFQLKNMVPISRIDSSRHKGLRLYSHLSVSFFMDWRKLVVFNH